MKKPNMPDTTPKSIAGGYVKLPLLRFHTYVVTNGFKNTSNESPLHRNFVSLIEGLLHSFAVPSKVKISFSLMLDISFRGPTSFFFLPVTTTLNNLLNLSHIIGYKLRNICLILII